MNYDTVSFTHTAPSAGAAMTVVSGDTASIRNCRLGSDVLGVALWAKAQGVGYKQVIWPSGHDLVRGERFRTLVGDPRNALSRAFPALFKPQDPLTVYGTGSATAGDVELLSLLLWYEDLPGVDAHLITVSELRRRGVNVLTIENSITATAPSTYSAAQALNAGSDLLKADTEYAILGAQIGVLQHLLSIRGPDTGNMRMAIPGSLDVDVTANWFRDLSEECNIPGIPVINSANRAGTFVELMSDENAGATPFSLQLVQLAR